MKLGILSAAAVAVSTMFAVPAFALTVTLDDFTTAQKVADLPDGPVPNVSTVPGGVSTGFLGTSRTFTATNTVFSGFPEAATTLQAGVGLLAFNNDSGARGKAELVYDGVGDLMNTAAGGGAFIFDVISFDGNAEFSLSGLDSFGKTVSYFENLASASFSPILKFTELTGYELFDFSNVASLSFTFSSENTADDIDGRLASITVASVPIPASGLLLLSAAGGLAALRRRRKASQAA